MSTERQILGPEGGLGPVPWSKAILWASEQGFDRRTREWFARVILTLDTLWREEQREENEKLSKREERQRKREQDRAGRQAGRSGIQKRRQAARQ